MTIEYFTFPELPDRTMFRCSRRSATLAVDACVDMWKAAQDRPNDCAGQCKNCPLGAKHAGVGNISLSPLRGMSICARCQRGTTRLVRRHICVSCANREYEYLKGRNARGSAPVKHPPLHKIAITVAVDSQPQTICLDRASGIEELIVCALRDSHKQVVFGFRGCGPNQPVGQMEMLL